MRHCLLATNSYICKLFELSKKFCADPRVRVTVSRVPAGSLNRDIKENFFSFSDLHYHNIKGVFFLFFLYYWYFFWLVYTPSQKAKRRQCVPLGMRQLPGKELWVEHSLRPTHVVSAGLFSAGIIREISVNLVDFLIIIWKYILSKL